MRYFVLAADYDGTLAHDGQVSDATIQALVKCRASGRHLVMVTGRELRELVVVCPALYLFELVVAENGGVLYRPSTKEARLLTQAPSVLLLDKIRSLGVGPISVGHAIIASWRPHEIAILEAIRELGLEMQVIFNKDAVMVLPSGVNKATGLRAALEEMHLSPHEVVGIGDAENDHAFLSICECGVAVANALPAIKERADLVTTGDHGRGVVEVIEELIRDDLASLTRTLSRHRLQFGTEIDGRPVYLNCQHATVLIAGKSGSGKSAVATSFLEGLAESEYQYCIVDPEGDYEGLEGVLALAADDKEKLVQAMLRALAQPRQNVAVNLVNVPPADRPALFLALWSHLLEMRARTGRPHWLILDETHHLLSATRQARQELVPQDLERMIFITAHPEHVAPDIIRRTDVLIAAGDDPVEAFSRYCEVIGISLPPMPGAVEPGQVVSWARDEDKRPAVISMLPSRSVLRKHIHKNAVSELGPDAGILPLRFLPEA